MARFIGADGDRDIVDKNEPLIVLHGAYLFPSMAGVSCHQNSKLRKEEQEVNALRKTDELTIAHTACARIGRKSAQRCSELIRCFTVHHFSSTVKGFCHQFTPNHPSINFGGLEFGPTFLGVSKKWTKEGLMVAALHSQAQMVRWSLWILSKHCRRSRNL